MPFVGFKIADPSYKLTAGVLFFSLPCVENEIQMCCDFTRKACSLMSCACGEAEPPTKCVLVKRELQIPLMELCERSGGREMVLLLGGYKVLGSFLIWATKNDNKSCTSVVV